MYGHIVFQKYVKLCDLNTTGGLSPLIAKNSSVVHDI